MDDDGDDGGGGDFTFAVLRPLAGGGGGFHGGNWIDAPLLYPLFGRPRSPPRRRAPEAEPTVTTTRMAPEPVPTLCHCPVCPVTPAASASPARCRKSGSTGSAVLRWRQRLVGVGRSHSDGNEKFVFLEDGSPSIPERRARSSGAGGDASWSWYAKRGNGAGHRRTFLPYRQDLVGLFGYATAFRRCYHPF